MATKGSVGDLEEADLKIVLVSNDSHGNLNFIGPAVNLQAARWGTAVEVIHSSHPVKMENELAKKELAKKELAKKLSSLANLDVNDEFDEGIGIAASTEGVYALTEGVAKYVKPSPDGFLMQKKVVEALAACYSHIAEPLGPLGVKPSWVEEAFFLGKYQASGKRQIREESSQPLKISFSDKDLQGKPPREGHLVIALKVGNCLVDKILVDTGCSCGGIMYFNSFKAFDFKVELMPPPPNVRLVGFNGQVEQPKGVTTLGVLAGSKIIDTQFLVIDAPSRYNVILGTSWIHEMKAVASTYHGLLKFPNLEGTAIEEIRGD